MADDDITDPQTPPADPPADPPAAPDLSFLPEEYKGDDGAWNTEGFRADYDALVAFKAQTEEAKTGLPEKPEDLAFSIGDDFEFPEGFDADILKHTDEDGNEVEFDVKSMIDPKDPDIPRLQETIHKMATGEATAQETMASLAKLMAGRELSKVMAAAQTGADEVKALGPEGKARIATVTRALKAKLPEKQASAVLDGITSADGLRAVEALIQKAGGSVPPAPNGTNYAGMSPHERVLAGIRDRA